MKNTLSIVVCATMIGACTPTSEDSDSPSLGEESTAQHAEPTESEVPTFAPEPIDLALAEAAARRDLETLVNSLVTMARSTPST